MWKYRGKNSPDVLGWKMSLQQVVSGEEGTLSLVGALSERNENIGDTSHFGPQRPLAKCLSGSRRRNTSSFSPRPKPSSSLEGKGSRTGPVGQEAVVPGLPLCGQKTQRELRPVWRERSARLPWCLGFSIFHKLQETGNGALRAPERLLGRMTLNLGQGSCSAEQLQTHYDSRFQLPLSPSVLGLVHTHFLFPSLVTSVLRLLLFSLEALSWPFFLPCKWVTQVSAHSTSPAWPPTFNLKSYLARYLRLADSCTLSHHLQK